MSLIKPLMAILVLEAQIKMASGYLLETVTLRTREMTIQDISGTTTQATVNSEQELLTNSKKDLYGFNTTNRKFNNVRIS